jgi:hypothetical protein
MKRIFKVLLLFVGMIFLSLPLTAQVYEPGDPGNGPQPGNPPLGGGAPLGSGTLILIGLGAAYGGRKIFVLKKMNKKDVY